jgi:hypothetical protein
MADKKVLGASARIVDAECRSTVEVAIPVGTRFDDLLARPDKLIEIISKFRPRGCEACLSGRDLLIRERFEEIINVDLGG